jgi:hypothetical protein
VDSDYWPVLPTSTSERPIEVTDDMIVKPHWLRRHWQVVVVALVVVIVVPLVWQKGETKPRHEPPITPAAIARTRPSDSVVYLNTIRLVREFLKAPRNAEFAKTFDITDMRDAPGQTRYIWVVESYVDSQNSFGVFLRSKFRCEVSVEKASDEWALTYLYLGDDLVHVSDEVRNAFEALKKSFEEESLEDRLKRHQNSP